MTFGEAIQALKYGGAVSRSGWNGKKMYLFLNKGSVASNRQSDGGPIDGVNPNLFDRGDDDTITRLPNINMMSASGSIVTGWLASQTDILAEDWDVLPATA